MTRMNEKFIASNTATVTDAERQAIRLEVLTFKESLFGLANSTDNNGDALYGGFSTEASPFVPMRMVKCDIAVMVEITVCKCQKA